MKAQAAIGFTLVEVAIVLVFVGLLVGGILKRQDMVTNSKMKRILSDNAGIAVAMFSYQDRYRHLPGDDSIASSRFDIYDVDDPVNGDGSGVIDGGWNEPTSGDITLALTSETNLFFAHLRAAGLLTGGATDDTRPTNAFGGQIGVRDGALGISGHVLIFGHIEGNIGKIMEARLDDSNPASGRIQAGVSSGAAPIDMNAAAVGSASYESAHRYNIAFQF